MQSQRPTAARTTNRLTPVEVDAFARNGYHFPVRALSAAEAGSYLRRLEAAEAALGTTRAARCATSRTCCSLGPTR